MSEFSGKRYIVTGAASGIGLALTERLLKDGAEVHSLDRNVPPVDVTRHIPVDLADIDSIDAAIAELSDLEYDGLLSIAGVPGTAPADVVVKVNSLAVRHLTENLLGNLAEGANVTIVSSTAGFGWPNRLETIRELLATDTFEEGVEWFAANPQEGNAYNFSKEVTTVYGMSMALAFNEMGKRINVILPGPVETPILKDFEDTMGKDQLDGLRDQLGRHATADDIASAVLFLASSEASWINGVQLVVDGGITGAFLSGTVPAPQI
jgi:NAD(P)-dependent dehydrogenase (short-subunit alcohol dehydrogenase family)